MITKENIDILREVGIAPFIRSLSGEDIDTAKPFLDLVEPPEKFKFILPPYNLKVHIPGQSGDYHPLYSEKAPVYTDNYNSPVDSFFGYNGDLISLKLNRPHDFVLRPALEFSAGDYELGDVFYIPENKWPYIGAYFEVISDNIAIALNLDLILAPSFVELALNKIADRYK